MIQKRSRIIFLISSTLISLCLNAQFRYSALLDSVRQSGFYSITITPELSSYLKTDLSDLRIVDEKKEWVPFIINYPYERRTHHPVLFDREIISNSTIDSNTVLQIENIHKNELSNIIFELKSAAAERIASLSGSDDGSNWFVILDSLLLQKSTEYAKTSHQQRINFPANNYKYLKLTIYNNKKQPLNILKASSSGLVQINDSIPPAFLNPKTSFLQDDSAGYSLITITPNKPYHVSRLQLTITKPWLYKRQAKLFTQIKNSLSETWYSQPQHSLTISSDEFAGYSFPVLKSDTIYLLIENGDNPSLQISSVFTSVINRNIIAFLEKGGSYQLLLDNSLASAPVYDLEHFKDRIPASVPLTIRHIFKLDDTTPVLSQKKSFKQWLWPSIIFILLILSFMTWKLTSDMKKRSD